MPPESSRQGPGAWDAVLVIAVLALANVTVTFLLVPGNPWILFPIHHDDYSDLALSPLDISLRTPRPIAMWAIAWLALAGPAVYSLALSLLLVLFPALVLLFVHSLFQ